MFVIRFFCLWGRARDKFFTGVLGRSGQRVKICGVGQGNGVINIIREKDGVRTLCHETALRYMLIQGAAPFFGGGVVLKIYWARHTRVAFSWGPGQGVRPCRLVQNSLEDSAF